MDDAKKQLLIIFLVSILLLPIVFGSLIIAFEFTYLNRTFDESASLNDTIASSFD